MLVEIYTPKKPTELVTRVVLYRIDSGQVGWVVVDEVGCIAPSGSNLATLSEDGLHLTPGVNPDFGFPLDERGRIRLVE